MAPACIRISDYARAFQQTSTLAPDNPEGWCHLAAAQDAAGDVTGALKNVKQALADGAAFKDRAAARALLAGLS
jgi:thioredoxin-like negative regulator of GroEL